MKEIKTEQIKCKNCPYYSGIECHGHGEYWATCRLIEQQREILSKVLKEYKYDLKLKHYESTWAEALNEESECLIFEIERY